MMDKPALLSLTQREYTILDAIVPHDLTGWMDLMPGRAEYTYENLCEYITAIARYLNDAVIDGIHIDDVYYALHLKLIDSYARARDYITKNKGE